MCHHIRFGDNSFHFIVLYRFILYVLKRSVLEVSTRRHQGEEEERLRTGIINGGRRPSLSSSMSEKFTLKERYMCHHIRFGDNSFHFIVLYRFILYVLQRSVPEASTRRHEGEDEERLRTGTINGGRRLSHSSSMSE